MAKKSISDIVLRAVVDTSGVAAGLNNVQAQVAGRRFGTVGGPQGATGAAGGFVSPHGGGAGPGVAAVAAAAAFGAGIGRGGGMGRAEALRQAAREGLPASFFGTYSMRSKLAGAGRISSRLGRDYFPGGTLSAILDPAAGISQDERADLLRQRFERAREQGFRRQEMLAELRRRRLNRMTFGALGAVGRGADALGAGLNRFGGMLGLGRFAPLGGAGLAIGGLALGGMAVARMADRTRQGFSDISRFQVGPDRATAAAISRTWNPPGQKAPIGAWERFLISARQANAGQTTWIERATRGAEQALFEQLPSQLGRASQGDLGALMEYNPAISGIAGSFFSNGALSPTAMFNTLRRLMA